MIIEQLLSSLTRDGRVTDVRVGTHWTAVVVSSPEGSFAGLASTQVVHDVEHGLPAVRDSGHLIGRKAADLARLALSESPTERSIGFATINALTEIDEGRCIHGNAEEFLVERGRGRRVAIVGHFPFVPRIRDLANECSVLELNPGIGDLPADQAREVIPRADVVAITGMTLVNGTFEGLAALIRPDAFSILLGASVPLVPILFGYGLAAISGTALDDIQGALRAVSEGANFRQMRGVRLVTMAKG